MRAQFSRLALVTLVLLLALDSARSAGPAEVLEQHAVALVGGYANHRLSGYFSETEVRLRELGAANVEIILPPSYLPADAGARYLSDGLLSLSERSGGKPLIVVAHSKGGLETLLALLRYPLLRARVSKAVLAQSVMSGAPLIDASLSGNFDAFRGIGFAFLQSGDQFWSPMDDTFGIGARSLSTHATSEALQAALRGRTQADIEDVSRRVLYWRGAQNADRLDPLLQPYRALLGPYGPSDGLLPIENQRLRALGGVAPFGADLDEIVEADHLALFRTSARPTPEEKARVRGFADRLVLRLSERMSEDAADRRFAPAPAPELACSIFRAAL